MTLPTELGIWRVRLLLFARLPTNLVWIRGPTCQRSCPPARTQRSSSCYCSARPALAMFVFLLAVSIYTQAQTTAQVSIIGSTQIRHGGSGQYSATMGGVPTPVAWFVNGFPGGNTTTGLITTNGVYSPSATIWAGHSVTITAKTLSQPVLSTAITVKVLNPLPVLSAGVITRTAPGNNCSVVMQGSGFVSTSQLQSGGVNIATVVVSSTRLQGTMSIAPGTPAVTIGVLSPDAGQKAPVSMTLPVPTGTELPTLTITPSSVPFGNTTINTPAVQTVTLASTGTAPVEINSAALSGTGFSMSGATFPVTLNPGLAITLDVQFDPITTGAATGTLSIQSTSSSNGMAVVSLTGTGTPHQVALSWDAPGSSTVPITSYNTYRLAPGDSAYKLLNSSVGPQTTYVDKTVQSGVTYDYIVTSIDSAGVESVPSNAVTATIP